MPRGVILIYVVLILGSVSLAAMAMLARGGIHAFADSTEGSASFAVRSELLGCLDEVLIQLQKDDLYAPANVSTGYATCQLSMATPASGQRTATLTLTEGSVTRRVVAHVTLSPFSVTQVVEQ